MTNRIYTIALMICVSLVAVAQDNPVYLNGKYEGEYKNGQKNGLGRATYYDGSMYMGEWKNDKRTGVGRAVYKDGSSYYGDWSDDKRSGKGTYEFINGDKYIGQFVDVGLAFAHQPELCRERLVVEPEHPQAQPALAGGQADEPGHEFAARLGWLPAPGVHRLVSGDRALQGI